jgi:hypothetical protein
MGSLVLPNRAALPSRANRAALPNCGGTPQAAEPDPDRLHRRLLALNVRRLRPSTPDAPPTIELDAQLAHEEERFLGAERLKIAERAALAPHDPDAFVAYFEGLEKDGPGQHDPLFPWLAEHADRESMRWFLRQELAGEAGFDDLVALAQRKIETTAKLEMARNYWDEMGAGHEKGMHGPMLSRLASELDLEGAEIDEVTSESGQEHDGIVWEALALANVMMGTAYNRRYAFHGIGALGAVELTAPGRCELVEAGLSRLGLSGAARRYYALHAVIDRKHAERWNREVLRSLVAADPSRARWLAEGALMRLEAGRRTFERYRRELGISPERAASA